MKAPRQARHPAAPSAHTSESETDMAAGNHKRNPGAPLDMGWLRNTRVNLSATPRRAQTLTARRSVKSHWQAAWLLRAITMIDLTTSSRRRYAGQGDAHVRKSAAAACARI